jgi:hypothetical protein
MNEKLELKLVAAFPSYFLDYKGDPTQTCMSWGCECGDGWYALIATLCSVVQSYYKHNTPDCAPFKFDQIKEKYGTLRIYYSGGDDTIYNFVQMTEYLSSTVCEECGATADVMRSVGWVKTMCIKCIGELNDTSSQWVPPQWVPVINI